MLFKRVKNDEKSKKMPSDAFKPKILLFAKKCWKSSKNKNITVESKIRGSYEEAPIFELFTSNSNIKNIMALGYLLFLKTSGKDERTSNRKGHYKSLVAIWISYQ